MKIVGVWGGYNVVSVYTVRLCKWTLQRIKWNYLYSGIPVESLNHSTNLAESFGIGEVTSQGNSTSFDWAAHINRTGTGTDKKKFPWILHSKRVYRLHRTHYTWKMYLCLWVHISVKFYGKFSANMEFSLNLFRGV